MTQKNNIYLSDYRKQKIKTFHNKNEPISLRIDKSKTLNAYINLSISQTNNIRQGKSITLNKTQIGG